MRQIEDKRLEEVRQFLTRPGKAKSREDLLLIVRDLTWVVEELQQRRLAERTPLKIEPDDRPFLLFGSDDSVLAFVEEHKLPSEKWKQATGEDVERALPRTVRSRKLDGADEELWKAWEIACRLYNVKTEGAES